jgi:hypothetical protein
VNFPGLPSHAESYKKQTIIQHTSELRIQEVTTFQGIPYADFFSVKTEWVIQPIPNNTNNNHTNTSTMSSDAKEISVKIYLEIVFHKSTWLEGTIASNTRSELIEVYQLWHQHATEYLLMNPTNASTKSLYRVPSLMNRSSVNLPEDEDEFFDCEDISTAPTALLRHPIDEKDNPHVYSHYIATCVETLFVVFEFYFRQAKRFYTHDLMDLLTLTPEEFGRRILNSFIPTRHASILHAPDIYGPLVAVFTLPQVLLLCMGSSRHGCSPISLMGNAVTVSLCLWLGLSFIYRVLAFVVSPTIGMRHCACMVWCSIKSVTSSLLL